jgi:ribonuclease BN (tRNA processing enzyme)
MIAGSTYLIDAGYGTTYRLGEKRIDLPSIRSIFITHHHSDHNLDLGPLIYNAWINGLARPIDAYGPKGIDRLLQSYFESNIIDIEIRMEDEGRPDPRKLVNPHVYVEGIVSEDTNVRVTALRNLHPPIESYALKFEIKGGKTVVFSGDTAYFPPLAAFARDADYLVHEVMYVPALDQVVQRNPGARTLMSHLRAAHTPTEDVGRIAAAANVKNLVLTHFVPVGNFSIKPEDWTAGIGPNYSGRIIVGRDGLEIPLV